MEEGVIINDSTTMNDIMTNWIVEHPYLITYLILEEALSYDDNNIPLQFSQKRGERHKKIIDSLKKSYNDHIFMLTPKHFNPSKQKTNLPPFLNSKYSFIKYKIENLKRKQFEEYSKNVAELLLFFGDDTVSRGNTKDSNLKFIPDNVIFNFNINMFNQDSFKESKKIISLKYLAKSFEEFNVKITNNLNHLSKSKNDQRNIILRIIQSLSKINDEVLSFFPLNPLEYDFEKFFFSSFFPFKTDFFKIVDNFQFSSPTDTISSILELCYKIIKYFNLPESPTDSILFLLIFRLLYDELYSRKALSFFQLNSTITNEKAKKQSDLNKDNKNTEHNNNNDNNNNDNNNNDNNNNDNNNNDNNNNDNNNNDNNNNDNNNNDNNNNDNNNNDNNNNDNNNNDNNNNDNNNNDNNNNDNNNNDNNNNDNNNDDNNNDDNNNDDNNNNDNNNNDCNNNTQHNNDNYNNNNNNNNQTGLNKKHKHTLFEYINSLTFTSIDPPEDSTLYVDSNFTMDHNIFEVVSSDNRFSSAINSLIPIIFATNPLDALNNVRLCLLGVEKTASLCFEKKEIACLISFDKVFTIFLFVIAGSGLEELFECYAPFVQSCIPERLLSLPFQFALTKLSAAETHLRRLMYEESNQNNDSTTDQSKQ
ncbi:hypothetical protein M9Y10_009355 [Tritrichomonas musculus]|uniref:VPS9 domain-containing protein n=1 Tax=Tritrichomonas musculus TaxID=1915356 RepID=A0ABR2IPZ2_9EUKA